MSHPSVGSDSAFSSGHQRSHQPQHRIAVRSLRDEQYLKLLMVALFLPEGLSFFIGDFRLSIARVLLIFLSIAAAVRFLSRVGTTSFVCIPSDVVALAAGVWMVIAAITTDGVLDGLKGAGALALEFTGSYFVLRSFLGPVDSSVRVIKFSCKMIVLVVGLALLDPLTGKLFTYETVKVLTGYVKGSFEYAKGTFSTTMYRNGIVRAMGPLEHSILFGTACVWFGALAMCTFQSRLFAWSVVVVAIVGVLISQSQGSLVCFILVIALAAFDHVTRQITARWRILGSLVGLGIGLVYFYSASPLATFLRLGGIKEETGWYRQAIWEAALPVVAQSPYFGVGLTPQWDWQSNGMLAGDSVDAFWLASALMFGIPGSILIFLTMASAFWFGAVDKSQYLSSEERKLSVALGFVIVVAVFQGFTVHIWGTCWTLLGVFAGMRANLAEAAIVRGRVARSHEHLCA